MKYFYGVDYDNNILKKILDSQRQYNASDTDVYSILRTIINEDLKSFHNGITYKMIESASPL